MASGSGTSARAVRHLRRSDPVLADVIRRVGPCRFVPRNNGTHFEALARAIVYQQLSGSAASTIHGRVTEVLGGVTPEAVLATADAPLRAAGLSRQKIAYMRDLASRVGSGELDLRGIHELPDEDIITAVCSVKGIGRWTAHMFLMFQLGRPDVLPELDLGVRKAVQREYGMRKLPSTDRLVKLGRRWAPFRSVASWYLWRSLEL